MFALIVADVISTSVVFSFLQAGITVAGALRCSYNLCRAITATMFNTMLEFAQRGLLRLILLPLPTGGC